MVGVLPLLFKELDKTLPDTLGFHVLLLFFGLGLCSFGSACQILDGNSVGTGLLLGLLSFLLGVLYSGISINLSP